MPAVPLSRPSPHRAQYLSRISFRDDILVLFLFDRPVRFAPGYSSFTMLCFPFCTFSLLALVPQTLFLPTCLPPQFLFSHSIDEITFFFLLLDPLKAFSFFLAAVRWQFVTIFGALLYSLPFPSFPLTSSPEAQSLDGKSPGSLSQCPLFCSFCSRWLNPF